MEKKSEENKTKIIEQKTKQKNDIRFKLATKVLFKIAVIICKAFQRYRINYPALHISRELTRMNPENPLGYYLWGILLLREKNTNALQKLVAAKRLSTSNKDLLPKIDLLIKDFYTAYSPYQDDDNSNNLHPFTTLPNNAVRKIFSYMDILEWVEIQLVCKIWYEYLKDNTSFSCCEFSQNKENGCKELILWKFLKIACCKSKPLHLHLEKFESEDSQIMCSRLFRNEYFSLLFKNLVIDKLVLRINSITTIDYMEDLVNCRWIDIYKPLNTVDVIDLELVLKSQPRLETLITHNYSYLGNLNHFQHLSLKRLQTVCLISADELSINCLKICPNLEQFEVCYHGIKRFNIESFLSLASESKLTTLSISNVVVGKEESPNTTLGTNCPSWPKELISLTMAGVIWIDLNVVRGSLEKLGRLTISNRIDLPEFFKQFNVGMNLALK